MGLPVPAVQARGMYGVRLPGAEWKDLVSMPFHGAAVTLRAPGQRARLEGPS